MSRIKSAIAGIAFVVMAIVGWDFCTADGPTERDLLVAAIVHEQLHSLARYPLASQSLLLTEADPARSPEEMSLKSWLIQHVVSDQDPAMTRASLQKLLNKEHSFSARTRQALRRWDETLHHWSSIQAGYGRGPSSHPGEGTQPDHSKARERYFEAKGYSGIDRGFDATAHYLWVISDLTCYLVRHPAAPDAAEVLLLLGDAYFELGDVLPVNVRPDRILHLVYEYYPESVWAKRAEALWMRGRRDAV